MRTIKNWLLRHLLNAITLDEILWFKDNHAYIGGIAVGAEELSAIKEEVKVIEATRIWTLLQGTLAEEAKDKIFNKSRVIEDVIWGKAMLYNLDIVNKMFAILKK